MDVGYSQGVCLLGWSLELLGCAGTFSGCLLLLGWVGPHSVDLLLGLAEGGSWGVYLLRRAVGLVGWVWAHSCWWAQSSSFSYFSAAVYYQIFC